MTLTIGVPFVGDTQMLTQCVKSLLAQTHKDLRVLVIGDGQAPRLRTRDSRVHVYKLPENRGSYFARAVALAATDTSHHGVVDSDDWVDPAWAETLLATGGDAVQHGSRWQETDGQDPHVQAWQHARRPLATRLLHYSSHTGIYRTDRMRAAGGYSPAFRVGYDSLLSAVLRLLGPVSVVDEPLYHRRLHGASLSHAPGTRIGSPERVKVREVLDVAYRKAYRMRAHPARVREFVAELTPDHLWDEVAHHAEKAGR